MDLTSFCDHSVPIEPHSVAGVLPEDAAWFLSCKATVDLAIASILLVITAPIILLLIVLVKATSRGPAIFKQVRLGRGGQPYHLYKIRTMIHDCEKLTGPQWSTTNDPRVTPLGRFLRRSHLDELPQLWNVIHREMSLVGPRPERPEFVAKLEHAIPDYRERMKVLPGITGLAQIQLPPDETLDDVCRKVSCDLCYIRQMSPALDLKILAGTTMKVMGFSYAMTRQILNLPGITKPSPRDEAVIPSEPGPISKLQST